MAGAAGPRLAAILGDVGEGWRARDTKFKPWPRSIGNGLSAIRKLDSLRIVGDGRGMLSLRKLQGLLHREARTVVGIRFDAAVVI